MATFPTLYPSTRAFTPGEYPHTPFQSLSNRNRRVLHSNALNAAGLQLTFVRLSQSDMLAVLAHYNGQQGEFIPFLIPSSILQGFTAADFLPADHLWRYASPPDVVDFCGPCHDVTVALESVGVESLVAVGLSLSVLVRIAGGAATASSMAPAMARTATLSMTAAPATGTDAAAIGAELSVTASLSAGSASGS
jgi:hypothetical protein